MAITEAAERLALYKIIDQSPFARWGWNPAPRPV